MRKKLVSVVPFIILPIFIPIYRILDSLVLVDVFGCGCVPIAQTNRLNILFNANDLRFVVFSLLTIGMCVWSFKISKRFQKKASKILYCFAVGLINIVLTFWVVKTFMWA